jgi:beta-ureidopropionase / N-carbamoyl-L-amino-acid hydrolase
MNKPLSPTHNLAIDSGRLWDTLMETAKIGGTAKGGINRLTLTDLDRQVRDWFKAQAGKLGCAIGVDDMGAIYARRRGQRDDIPPIGLGSHLDTQPTGGKFDGTLGTLAALEVLRTLEAAGYETYAPIEIVNWTNEEGSRFAPALIASGVFGGVFERDFAYAQKDRAGISFGQALQDIGYRGPERCGTRKFSAFFELHIEQGPILEREGIEIGVVSGVQGVRWFDVILTGRDAHAGTTPMSARRDAMVGAARAVQAIDRVARAHPPLAMATVGMIEAKSNSRNVVPGEVFFSIDIRHPQYEMLETIESEIKAAIAAICSELSLDANINRIWEQAPVPFHPQCIDAVRKAAAQCGLSTRDIVSGALHDAAYVARVAPAGMIFVPCKDGISHNEEEFSSQEQCAKGAQVLLQAVLEFDRRLAEPGVSALPAGHPKVRAQRARPASSSLSPCGRGCRASAVSEAGEGLFKVWHRPLTRLVARFAPNSPPSPARGEVTELAAREKATRSPSSDGCSRPAAGYCF